jgi:hypothetical protein
LALLSFYKNKQDLFSTAFMSWEHDHFLSTKDLKITWHGSIKLKWKFWLLQAIQETAFTSTHPPASLTILDLHFIKNKVFHLLDWQGGIVGLWVHCSSKSRHRQKIFSYSVCVIFEFKSVGSLTLGHYMQMYIPIDK